MFRKLSDQLSAAFSGSSNSRGDAAKVQQLVALGFPEGAASETLRATGGDVDRAAELLLNQRLPTTANGESGPTMSEEEQMRRAMEASLQQRPPQASPPAASASRKKDPPHRTAAMTKAAQAAIQRTNTKSPPTSGNSTLSDHHPKVKVIPKISDKSVEEQILRTADRLKTSYLAVDTLLRALKELQQNPENPKFRTIDTATAGYQRSLAPAPGAADFLAAMRYRPVGSKLVLDAVDPALLFLGISALDQTKSTTEYRMAKGQAVLNKELQTIRAAADSSEQEAIRRAVFLSQVPSEPDGRSTNLQITLGEETVRRKFEADDTLENVMHWVGAHGSQIFENLQKGTWVLLDVNRNVVLDAQRHLNDTLHYLECWPSGRLQLTTRELVDLQGSSK